MDHSEAVLPSLGKFVFVIKNITRDKMADLNVVFGHVCEVFGIKELNAYQREAIVQFVQKKTDVLVNFPTGNRKSLIYQALPFVYDSTIREAAGHIVVVVSLLVNLMKDQVDKLANLGILAASLSEITEENALQTILKWLHFEKGIQSYTN